MALTSLATTTANVDLTGGPTVLNSTLDASNPRWCQIHCAIGDGANLLDGSGGNFEFALYIAGKLYGGAILTRVVDGVTSIVMQTPPFLVPANNAVTFTVYSPNGYDTSVNVSTTIFDIPAGNVVQISNDATAADNLEAYCDGTTPIPANTTQIEGVDATDQLAAAVTGGDTYTAIIKHTTNDTGHGDTWIVEWYKNGEPITSGITSPTLTVTKLSDSSVLLNAVTPTQVSGTHLWRYTTTASRIVGGADYNAVCSATIDSATRTGGGVLGRDG